MEISENKLQNLLYSAFLIGSKLQFASDKSMESNLEINKSQSIFLQMCEQVTNLDYTTVEGTADFRLNEDSPLNDLLTDDFVHGMGKQERQIEQLCCTTMIQSFVSYNNLKNGVYFATSDSGNFSVVTKKFWGENECLEDDHISEKILFPIGFTEIEKSIFRYEGDVERGIELLEKFGFIENKNIPS